MESFLVSRRDALRSVKIHSPKTIVALDALRRNDSSVLLDSAKGHELSNLSILSRGEFDHLISRNLEPKALIDLKADALRIEERLNTIKCLLRRAEIKAAEARAAEANAKAAAVRARYFRMSKPELLALLERQVEIEKQLVEWFG